MDVKDFLRLKDEIEKRKRAKERDEIRKEGLIQRLEKEFGCRSISEAKNLVGKMEQDTEELELAFQKKLKSFQESHDGLFGTD